MINKITIVCLGDARPSKFGSKGITDLTSDLNQVVPQSPTGQIDAIFMIGDMDKISQTEQARIASVNKNIPLYYVIGNHEIDADNPSYLKGLPKPTLHTIHPGPSGTEKTTYSVDVGNLIHVVNLNIYWNEATNDTWLGGGSGGGFVGSKLSAWLLADLKAATTLYKIVLVHEPLYPAKRHVGDSLDSNPSARDALQKLMNDNGVDCLVAAHTHFATTSKHGNVLHVDAGISGAKTQDPEDPYASMFFMNVADNGDMICTWKHDNSGSWNSPTIKTYTLPQGTTPPVEIWNGTCILPLKGLEISNLGNTRPNVVCNPPQTEVITVSFTPIIQ